MRNREVVPFGFILPSAWLIRVSVIAGTAAPSASSAVVCWLPTYAHIPIVAWQDLCVCTWLLIRGKARLSIRRVSRERQAQALSVAFSSMTRDGVDV